MLCRSLIVMVGLGPTIHEFLSAGPDRLRQTHGWSCQARPWRNEDASNLDHLVSPLRSGPVMTVEKSEIGLRLALRLAAV